jgi:methylisocitrate lyase
MWYPDLCGKAHDSNEITMDELKKLGNYKLVGIHYSMHASMLSMLDVGRHVMMEQTNDYVDYHFDDTGYKCFTTMSMFGLANGYWPEREGKYVRSPEDSVAKRNADYFVRDDDVLDPDKKR